MVKIVGISILRQLETTSNGGPIPLISASDLTSYGFFQRGAVGDMLKFFSKTFITRTPVGQRQSVQHESYIVHCYKRADGLCGCVTTDLEYPPRVAFLLLSQLLDEFTTAIPTWKVIIPDSSFSNVNFPIIEEYLVKFQDPAAADKITKIQKDLDDTTEILHKTIDSVLERGVKLDQLVERSDDLSKQSKMFYKQAKKTNSCCIIS
ncbi:hypothetical protein ScalyP_jg6184 [Parmales sp. scaly parma]|nr:hypothetical protein ScalyP_jg6184 [Parmales sp. scaly parma]|tara:strand:- start:41 stop:658 length:618 start_codon:yes stop_codon:yes gene_type:complete